jgi:hypothetical protein
VNKTFETVVLSTGELTRGKPAAALLTPPSEDDPTMGYEIGLNSDDEGNGNFVSLVPPGDTGGASKVFLLDDGFRADGCPKAEALGDDDELYFLESFLFFVSETTSRAYLLYGTKVTDHDNGYDRILVVVASTSVGPNSLDDIWSCSLATSYDGLFAITFQSQSS